MKRIARCWSLIHKVKDGGVTEQETRNREAFKGGKPVHFAQPTESSFKPAACTSKEPQQWWRHEIERPCRRMSRQTTSFLPLIRWAYEGGNVFKARYPLQIYTLKKTRKEA
jgi:hypothetical protein